MGEIENVMFRELHKLAVVFEVKWLTVGCHTWLTGEINIATSDEQKTFVFDECWYILKQWREQTMMDTLISVLVVKDNSTLLSKYMAGLDKLETKQIDLMLILGGTDTDLFLHTILLNLSDEKELNQSVKYLLEKMNLALCYERNEELYHRTFDFISEISEISVDDMRSVLKMKSDTMKLISLRSEKMTEREVIDMKKYKHLTQNVKTLQDVTTAVSEGRITSVFMVVELLLCVFITIHRTRKTEKHSYLHLKISLTIKSYKKYLDRF